MAVEPTTRKWVTENSDWFTVLGDGDERSMVMTAAAFALDNVLKREGFDPRTPEFYAEMDRRLDRWFPNRKQAVH